MVWGVRFDRFDWGSYFFGLDWKARFASICLVCCAWFGLVWVWSKSKITVWQVCLSSSYGLSSFFGSSLFLSLSLFFDVVKICIVLFVSKVLLIFVFAGAARRAGPDSMSILCQCVSLWVWDNFSVSDWSKFGDVARRRTT